MDITEEEEWVGIGTYQSLDDAYDHGLVALSMGESIRVEQGASPGEFDLQAESAAADRITGELHEYSAEMEQRELPRIVPSDWAKYSAGWSYIVIWAAVLVVIFTKQTEDPELSARYASSSIGLIRNGEWWRPFTALFLHGDGPHIVGNLVSGTVFSILVSKSLGPLKGWLLILLSGTLGNITTSWVTYPEHFSSIGASTAVFGALGILSGVGIIENIREDVRMPWVRVVSPIFAGLVLLGWLGGASPNTGVDVLGHIFGFCAGVLCGILASLRGLKSPGTAAI
ncbi:rhomboid family intramembrane serine protease [Luteolibacter sp. AS25]|uniref:rhomboid family intramembrane serine protease n=1 Tax=Luteolibacter sp. AS25 TaxID=3135776 RepID=UPI00398A9881